MHSKLKNGVEVEESKNSDSISLSPGERTAIVWNYPKPAISLLKFQMRLVFEILSWTHDDGGSLLK